MNNIVRPEREWMAERLRVREYSSRRTLGEASGKDVARRIRLLQERQEHVRMVFAAAPSQNEFLETLAAENGINWDRVVAFHLDEYVGLANDAPQSFGLYLEEHLFSRVKPGRVNLMNGGSKDLGEECRRYSGLLLDEPIDIACVGIGENGHLAFNDPPVADFLDPEIVKVVTLEEKCRLQQVHDGCFESLELVPSHALTMTIPAIMSADFVYCMVPGASKTAAVRETLEGPVAPSCPASILKRHLRAALYLDAESARGCRQTV